MARRSWDSLSAPYRRRLVRGGITRRQYESGASLQKARGHEKTPERPEQAEKNPDRYREYREKKKALIGPIVEFKRRKWENNPNNSRPFNAGRSRANVIRDPDTGKERGIRELTILAHMAKIAEKDRLEFWDIVALNDEEENAFYYH